MDQWWIVALDILICTLVLRIIIGWLLAYPRLIRLLVILVLVLLLGFSVNVLELPLAGLLAILLLIPVVVILFLSFLPELGRVYQAASRGNLFRPRIFQSEEILPDLAEALAQFRERRIGCLLVFPGTQDEAGLVSGGEEVDARVNRSLLLSIFDPHCPRHDGAAVIRNNRIVRIGAVLPLASAEGAEAHLGTRHLAAIGMSERIDGHVLVVSEERGTLSVAYDGKLEVIPFEDAKELRSKLLHLLGNPDPHQLKDKQKLLPYFLWGLSGVLAAVGSWQVELVTQQFKERYSETVYFQSVDASIQYTLDPSRQFVSNWKTTSARLDLRIPEAIPRPVSQASVLIDLKEEPFGQVSIALQSDMVTGLPEGTVVQGFDPQTVEFTLAEVKKTQVPLEMPEIRGVRDELLLDQAVLVQSELLVQVRDLQWKEGQALKTKPVDLSSISEPGTYKVEVEAILPASLERSDAKPVLLEVTLKQKPVPEKVEAESDPNPASEG